MPNKLAWQIWSESWAAVGLVGCLVIAVVGGWRMAAGVAVLAMIFYVITTLAVFALPASMATPLVVPDPYRRLSAENEVRATFVVAVAGVALIGTLLFGWQGIESNRQQMADARQEFETQTALLKEQQRAERFAVAVGQLSSDKTEGRLGGVATLVQIVESADQERESLPECAGRPGQAGTAPPVACPFDYREDALRYLGGFVRSISRGNHPAYRQDEGVAQPLAVRVPEAQSASDAITRLSRDRAAGDVIDLSGADLVGVSLRGARLGVLRLTGADLRGADLRGADFTGAALGAADLRGADLGEALNLSEADLSGALVDSRTEPRSTPWHDRGALLSTVTIDEPRTGAGVAGVIAVTGEAQDLAPDSEVWVAVYVPKIERYYPHRVAATLDSGRWSLADVGVGGENEQGQPFEIVAFVADQGAARFLRAYAARGASGGLLADALPDGMVQMFAVGVTRS